MVDNKKQCFHKKGMSLYARGEKTWISTQKITGQMTYVCPDCKKLYTKENKEVEE